MSEDFDIFSITPAADEKLGQSEDKRSEGGKIGLRPPPQAQQKRFSTHLAPSDALPRNNLRYPVHKNSIDIFVTNSDEDRLGCIISGKTCMVYLLREEGRRRESFLSQSELEVSKSRSKKIVLTPC